MDSHDYRRQDSLFDSRAVLPGAPPNLDFIRNNLTALLRIMRNAEIMPWHKADARAWERNFPILATLLPAEEAATLLADFERELARLKAAT